MDTLIWPAAILLLSIALLGLEMFIPSGGILGFLSVVAMIASIFVAFHNGGIVYGTGFIIVTTVLFPTMIVLAIWWWPRTPIGRRMLNRPGDRAKKILPNDSRQIQQLIGKRGRSKCTMLPAGAIVVEGRTYDAITRGMPIEADQIVEVIEVSGNRIVVAPSAGPLQKSRQQQETEKDLLSQPLDILGLDDLGNPLS